MNKKIIISMSMPMHIENKKGKKATLLINKEEYIVCKYDSGETYTLKDVNLKDWFPSSKYRRFMYNVRHAMA